jgi:RNA polymerase sigma factor (sigma-70 family)
MDDENEDDPLDDAARQRRFVTLYERHYPDVLAYARRRGGEAAARDVAAEVFLVAWRRLNDAEARGLPWLYRTAALTLDNWRRAQRRQLRVADRVAGEPRRVVDDPADGLADGREPVLVALRSLPPRDREVLLLHVWEQLDVRDVAQVVGCTRGAAAVRLHRARRRLRAALAAATVDPPLDDVPSLKEAN